MTTEDRKEFTSGIFAGLQKCKHCDGTGIETERLYDTREDSTENMPDIPHEIHIRYDLNEDYTQVIQCYSLNPAGEFECSVKYYSQAELDRRVAEAKDIIEGLYINYRDHGHIDDSWIEGAEKWCEAINTIMGDA